MSNQDEGTQRNRAEVEKVVNRIAEDTAYRKELLDNPAQALQALGLAPASDSGEVTGYLFRQGKCSYTCIEGGTCGTGPTCGNGTCTDTQPWPL